MDLHTAIVLYGSRGDIQPGICLALELQGRGHRVTVLAPPDLTGMVTAAGVVEVIPIGTSMVAAWTTDEGREALRARNPIRKLRYAAATFGAAYRALDDSLAELTESPALRDIDLLISGPVSQNRCLALSESIGVPLVVVRYGPLSENGVIGAYAGLTDKWSPKWKRRSWRFHDRLGRLVSRGSDTRFRARIGLPPSHGPLPAQLAARGVPQIQAFDSGMAPSLRTEWSDPSRSSDSSTCPPMAAERWAKPARPTLSSPPGSTPVSHRSSFPSAACRCLTPPSRSGCYATQCARPVPGV